MSARRDVGAADVDAVRGVVSGVLAEGLAFAAALGELWADAGDLSNEPVADSRGADTVLPYIELGRPESLMPDGLLTGVLSAEASAG